jgi:outer membrane protein assembly factor BamB
LINKSLAVGIIFLFIVSSTTPMVIGYDVETPCEPLDDLTVIYSDDCDSNKASSHMEQFPINYDDELQEMAIPKESPQTVATTPMDSPWPMICHDLHHTGRSPYNTASNPGTEKWRYKTESWVYDTPVIDGDGIIYVGSFSGYFYAIYPDGTQKWRSKLAGTLTHSSPAIDENGTIYVGCWDRYLYAINPDGSLKWMFGAGANIGSSPAIAEDGTIYFGTLWTGGKGGKIFAVNPDGTEKWRYQTGYAVSSSPAIGDDGTIYIGSYDDYLYALYPNGTLRWRFKTGDNIIGSPSIADDGTIYIGSYDDYLYALYPNGTMKWKFYTEWGTSGNPSIAIDGTIYVGTDKLYAIYPDGTLRWSFDLGADTRISFSSPAISADGTIYIGTHIGQTSGGDIIAINPDGTERWRKLIANNWVYSSPSIAEDGTVYIGSSSIKMIDEGYSIPVGYIHAFGPIDSNEPPEPPSITGATNGNPRREYYYRFSTSDPDENPVSFYVDWGDGTITDWSGGGEDNYKMDECASGETVFIKHVYSRRGTYTIKAKARDGFGGESDWATLEVSMPKNKPYINTPFFNILENHPHLFPILRYLMEL